jgi:hypothetical protein
VLACVGCAENFKLPPVKEKGFSETATARWRFRAGVCAAVIVVVFFAIEWIFVHLLTKANLVPVFWRSIHIMSGVSALLPQLFLLTGMYCWFWFSLRGLALFGDDRPRLPKLEDMGMPNGPRTLRMFSREDAGKSVECCALPISRRYLGLLILIVLAVGVISAVVLSGPWLRTLGELTFGIFIFLWLTLCISLVLADAAQCWCTWRQLRELLIDLDRLPLRRTLYALHGLSWRSVWAMSGNVLTERYSLISQQIEALRHLGNRLAEYVPATPDRAQSQTALLLKIRQCQTRTIPNLAQWYTELNDKPVDTVQPLAEVQEEFALIAGETLTGVLIPSWQTEMDSLIFGRPDVKNAADDDRSGPVISRNIPVYVLAAEEFFVLPYVGFIQNILGRIRTIVLGSLWLFVATTLAVSSYPFDPMPILGGIFLAVFVIIGTTMILIYAGMHRDATLSYITGSEPGELGGEFWRQLFTFGIGPLLGLLTTLFPSITDFVMSWLQPSSPAIK